MIIPELPPPSFSRSSNEDSERLERALSDLVKEDQWIGEFIERLNYTIAEIVRKH